MDSIPCQAALKEPRRDVFQGSLLIAQEWSCLIAERRVESLTSDINKKYLESEREERLSRRNTRIKLGRTKTGCSKAGDGYQEQHKDYLKLYWQRNNQGKC